MLQKSERSARGAVLVEALFIMPLVMWLIIASIQLLWLFWAQHTLYNTSHYVLRAGQLQHGNVTKMTNVLASGMASTQLQWHESETLPTDEMLRENTWASTLKSLVHARLASKISIHSPTADAIQNFSEQRYDLKAQKWVQEIAIDHAKERASQSQDAQAWLTARQLDIEIWWCLPLEIPFVAGALQSWRQVIDSEPQRFCRLREGLLGKPLWPLVARRKGPMMSGFRVE
ncbi:MAG: hypothetical protein B7X54_02340 [Idiomarina sp. 34-48-12]|nr:MAG: hypothetical protein B7X54_02340 [Idiomarina sp. 34-48-12]